LRPEGLMHKIGSLFGYQDIDFDSHPNFSKHYLLRGSDEEAIRELFDDDLLSFFETQEKVCVEADGHDLIIYRQRKRIEPDTVQEFLREGFGIFARLRGVDDE